MFTSRGAVSSRFTTCGCRRSLMLASFSEAEGIALAGRRGCPRSRPRIAAAGEDAEALEKVRPADRVLRRFVGHEPAVLELDESAAGVRAEPDEEPRRAGRHRFV